MSKVEQFGSALWDLFVHGKLPDDATPLTSHEPDPRDVVHVPVTPDARAVVRDCARCDGEGEVLKQGVVVPCPADGCGFRKRG